MNAFAAIPVFLAVIERGGFSAAARTLGISKSAVSKRVTQLEAELGVRLLHRSTRRLSLTEAGQRYYYHAMAAWDAARQAEEAATELQDEPHGLLRINVPMSFGRLHVAPLIPLLLQRHPGLEVDLVLNDLPVDLVADRFDVAIRIGLLPDSSLVARKLAPCLHTVCASPEYLEKHGRPSSPDQLRSHNCLLFSYSSDANEWLLPGDGGEVAVHVSGNYRANNSEALLVALRAGTGIGRLPTFIAGPDLRTGQLVELFKGLRTPPKSIYALMPEREYVPAKSRAFIDFAIEHLGGDTPYWDT